MTWSTVEEYLCHRSPRTCSFCRNHNPVLLSSFMIYHRNINMINTTGVTIGARPANHSGAQSVPIIPLVSQNYSGKHLCGYHTSYFGVTGSHAITCKLLNNKKKRIGIYTITKNNDFPGSEQIIWEERKLKSAYFRQLWIICLLKYKS
jgi:hypothetical protein